MSLIKYFETKFWIDLQNVPTFPACPEEYLDQENLLHLKHVRTFGDSLWDGVDSDISNIENKERFILTLFTLSIIDHSILTNVDLYNKIARTYNLPKLGWRGYSSHFVHPFFILKSYFKQSALQQCETNKQDLKAFFTYIFQQYKDLPLNRLLSIIKDRSTNIDDAKHHLIVAPYIEDWSENDVGEWQNICTCLFVD